MVRKQDNNLSYCCGLILFNKYKLRNNDILVKAEKIEKIKIELVWPCEVNGEWQNSKILDRNQYSWKEGKR